MDKADIILVVIDRSRSLSDEDKAILEDTKDKNVLVVLNKTDLMPVVTEKDLAGYGHPVLSLSAGTGDGLDSLKDKLLSPGPVPCRYGRQCPTAHQYAPYRTGAPEPASPAAGPRFHRSRYARRLCRRRPARPTGAFGLGSRAIRSTTIWSKKYSVDSV